MPSYVVTGASRGLGLEFVRQLSAHPENQVFALVRNKQTSTNLKAFDDRQNVHVFQADVVDHNALKVAASEISTVTGGKLDVLINNAGIMEPHRTAWPLTAFDGHEDLLVEDIHKSMDVNVIGVIHTTNVFLPLLKRGTMKKVITISSGVADNEYLEKTGWYFAAPYAISKVAVNMVVTKYAIQFKQEGIIFLALSPGLVSTGMERPATPDATKTYELMVAMLRRANPTFEGAITPEVSVKAQLQVIKNVTLQDSGAFISHLGNKQWV